MWRRCVFMSTLLSSALAFSATGSAQPSSRDEDVLPLTRVRIHETGIAYFERQGKVEAGASIALPLTGGHLDDVLKTLVVLRGEGDVEVSGIEFETALTRAKASATLGLDSPGEAPELDLVHLLQALRGAGVELVLESERVQGQVLGVMRGDPALLKTCEENTDTEIEAGDSKPRTCDRANPGSLTLKTAAGALRRFAFGEVRSVVPLDPAVKKSMGAALSVLSGGGASRRRSLQLEATKGGTLALGYLSEAPLWRASYRLLLSEVDAAPTLQAWALLHNDSDEDWRDVAVELVNGRPDSYLFDATAKERGSLFEYALPGRVALAAHSSLLVPLLTRPLEVTRYVRFEGASESGQSVLSVSNTTDHTLPSDPLAVYADGGFAGESALRRLKPGQSQLLQFGTELDLSIEETARSESDAIRQVLFRSGKLELHSIRERRLVVHLTNTARHAKTALLRLSLVNNAKVTSSAEWMRRLLALESRVRVTQRELDRLERLDPWAQVRTALAKLPSA